MLFLPVSSRENLVLIGRSCDLNLLYRVFDFVAAGQLESTAGNKRYAFTTNLFQWGSVYFGARIAKRMTRIDRTCYMSTTKTTAKAAVARVRMFHIVSTLGRKECFRQQSVSFRPP